MLQTLILWLSDRKKQIPIIILSADNSDGCRIDLKTGKPLGCPSNDIPLIVAQPQRPAGLYQVASGNWPGINLRAEVREAGAASFDMV